MPATAAPTQQSPCATEGYSKPSPIRRAAVKLDFGAHPHTEAWSPATVPSKEAAGVSLGQDTTLHLAAVAAQLRSWQRLGGPSEAETLHGVPTLVHRRCSSISPSRVVPRAVTWSPRVVPESSRVSGHLPSAAENRCWAHPSCLSCSSYCASRSDQLLFYCVQMSHALRVYGV